MQAWSIPLGMPRFPGHCYGLRGCCELRFLFQGHVADRGMQTPSIVEAFDILKHIGPGLVTGQIVALVDQLHFQG